MAIDFRRILSVGQVLYRQISTPSAPAASTVSLYAKSDAEVYVQTPAGVERRISAVADPRYVHQEVIFPNTGDFSSGTFADIITAPTFTVPDWAQDGTTHAIITFRITASIITAAAAFDIRVVAGATNGTASNYGAAGSTTAVTGECGIDYTLPAATSTLTYKLQAARTSGTGALRASSAAKAFGSATIVLHR